MHWDDISQQIYKIDTEDYPRTGSSVTTCGERLKVNNPTKAFVKDKQIPDKRPSQSSKSDSYSAK